ncbi:hypothetical protein [Pseudomonas sp. R3-52-08]|uniref:hypothetical protein n=1 Tax=Pseudomonas sp. R3-52-08 TaxID=1173284 RepID=UPI000F56ECED|nr:hypothetical protein [Pseudomonas sp. R3-52-08]AZF22329.1 hypothetical protein C4J91_3586 [Pseudomonas sp. R3-52-08]
MAALEKRYPRESFTRKLTRICQKLDEASTRAIAHKDFFNKAVTSRVEITSLWAVGSYARGALMCGDLDLVLEYQLVEGPHPAPRTMTKTFFGAPPYVSYYFGKPESSTSGVAFPDAIVIWTEPGCDWRAAIDSIKPVHSAGRAARETDSIPLRPEQLYMEAERLQELAAQERKGLVDWEFVEFTSADLDPVPAEEVSDRDRKLLRIAPMMGKKSQALIPAIIRLMARYEPNGGWGSSDSYRVKFSCGATALHLGRPALPHNPFEELTIKQYALLPHISRKGPNGAWVIRRGPNHPDTKALANRHAYYLGSQGYPETVAYRDRSKIWSTEMLELFSTHEDAEEFAAMLDEERGPPNTVISRAEGLDLISLFALVDVVEIGEHQLAITRASAAYFERDKAKMDEIVAALPLAINPAPAPSA